MSRNHRLSQAQTTIACGDLVVSKYSKAAARQSPFEMSQQVQVVKCASAEADPIDGGRAPNELGDLFKCQHETIMKSLADC